MPVFPIRLGAKTQGLSVLYASIFKLQHSERKKSKLKAHCALLEHLQAQGED